ncbi:ribose-phosphate diphosphokinase [Aliiglaciecola sp. CAU 1673]|uniref:ribose-phosphate diphosphokinase n=1 Tax=Aliiglaciecola sp. CAU 1673 TaxID=3032595 RepID=UPI0023D9EFFF|nr:ribose-phosphate diphosphokinase [Aliiglaciecola sp. CAU 1673]MDF2180218.1 ribose-phosphate diphosphokinase [Aliiglaciecola sp. CAU 1673]
MVMLPPLLFSPRPHPLEQGLANRLECEKGRLEQRLFPDGESYLRLHSDVKDRDCIILLDLTHPNDKYLPLIYLTDTLREYGARSIGLVVPYLPYMRQDIRFHEGEAITSRIFAKSLSNHLDYMVTIDPHLHRYDSLDEIYSIKTKVVAGAPALANHFKNQSNLLLVGPDSESEQWVGDIARHSDHPFVIGEKLRSGDRKVKVSLPDLSAYSGYHAVIIDDVISSGQTLLQCLSALHEQGITQASCAAVHGIFADQSDQLLMDSGIESLITCNTIPHSSNLVDVTDLLIDPIKDCLGS